MASFDAGGDNFYLDGPHFDPSPPDSIGFDSNECGNLVFVDNTRAFTTIYASKFPEESPYKHWWQRARWASNGATAALAQVDTAIRAAGVPDTATILSWLSDQYNASGTQLIPSPSSAEVISEEAFTADTAHSGMNLALQYWQHIDAPTLNSATATDDDVTLSWTNGWSVFRSIDSTNIYRNGNWLRTVRSAATSFVDSNVPSGTHTYTLKHVSLPVFHWTSPVDFPWPNSATSNAVQVTVNLPPTANFTYSCAGLSCTFTDSSTDPDGSIVGWSWTFGDGGSSTLQNPTHPYAGQGTYSVRLVVTDNLGAPDDTTRAVQVGPRVTIGPPCYIYTPDTYTWTANVTGGTTPYTYQWWYKKLGGGTWQKLNGQTGPTYTRYVGYSQGPFQLKVDVKDAYLLTATDTKAIDVAWGARPITDEGTD